MFFRTISLLVGVCCFISCAHHNDVRPGASGLHRVVIVTEDTDAGSRNAIAQANHYCKEKNKEAVFVEEDKKYTGSMDESTYKTGKTMAKVAKAAGGAAFVFGKRKASNTGGVVSLGGGIADSALGNGYTVEMKFKCQ